MRNKILELKFQGEFGTATIVLTRKLTSIPEGMANIFPLTIKFFSVKDPERCCHYYCRNREDAVRSADDLVKGFLRG